MTAPPLDMRAGRLTQAIDFGMPIKKPHVLGGALGLDAFGREALAYRCDALDGCDSTTSIQKDAITYHFGTDSPSIHRPQGGLAVAVIRAHPGQNCIPSDPLDAGASQNRSSGHEGEGPPARKAKGYGQRRWVGQHRVSRIGVPKASNDRVLLSTRGDA